MGKRILFFLSILLAFTTAFSSVGIIKALTSDDITPDTTIELQKPMSSQLQLWSDLYNPSKEQLDEITKLIKDGADIDILMKICEFWEDTDAPFSIIAEIYAKAPEAEALEQIADHTVWIERTYNEITGNDNNLSVEEVKEYLSLGVSLDDLYVANRAARKSTVSPKEVLDRRVTGEDWIEIIAPHIENEFSSEEREVISGHDVLDSLIVERKTGMEPAKILKSSLESNTSVMSTYSAFVDTERIAPPDEIILDSVN